MTADLPPLPAWAKYPDDERVEEILRDYARLAINAYLAGERKTKATDHLPPLPNGSLLVECGQSFVDGWTSSEVRAYAKLAVRQALELVLERLNTALEWDIKGPCAGAYNDQANQAVKTVRAMIEEFK